ncbi:MAG: serine hydrolase domain-containing protein, partial [Gemmatimonadota bacterium]
MRWLPREVAPELLLVLVCLLPHPLRAQEPSATVEAVVDDTFEAHDAAAVDSFVRAAMEELDVVPGLALAVVEDGRIVHEAGFGDRDRAAGLPITPRTVFYTASLAKAFTGATAAVLASDGAIDLNAPLVRFFPELTTEPPVDAGETTLRDLLRHGKSFRNGAVNFVTTFVGPYERSELVRVLNEYSDPSEGFAYSNEAYALTGYAIEEATGRDWRDVMRDRVFRPLGMERSTARLSAIDSSDVALPYLAREDGIRRIEFAKSDRTITGAGGIFSSAHDLARFVIAQLDEGRVEGGRRLPAAAVREMQIPQIRLDRTFFEFERYAYGLGLYLARWEGEELFHHFGAFPGFRSHLSFMPAHDVGVVVLQNEGVDGNR